ncbi:2'-5' RNA ligase family protein [Streptomyces sp. NBC_00885]|uniref:2'-5' RNA ligase family protein n=1 Tax=Streptomyces sp. NBC_00885 TaxID=2975857 RepID=UPI00386BB347|nr:2'-5' RNA ligase family protein [Streptomyces sp. NBC_00885]
MERFVPRFQGHPWVDGMRVLHAYIPLRPGVDDELLALVHTCRPAMAGYPIDPLFPADPADPGVLHLTVEMVADATATDIGPAERTALADALREALSGVSPFETQVGPPIGNIAGVVLDVWPDEAVLNLQEGVRTAIRKTRGDTALQHSGGRPHMQLGYSYGAASSDLLNSVLRGLTPRRAPLRVGSVHLLDVCFAIAPDTGGWRMTWEPVAEIPLGY